jgi:hypothetical protein
MSVPLAFPLENCPQEILEGGSVDVNPMAAAMTGALISGVAMYAIGAHAQDSVRKESGAGRQSGGSATFAAHADARRAARGFMPLCMRRRPKPVVYRQAAAPRQTVYRTAQPRIVSETVDTRPHRSGPRRHGDWWTRPRRPPASAASSAARRVTLIGAAIGGGAASIYEASRSLTGRGRVHTHPSPFFAFETFAIFVTFVVQKMA